MLRNLLCWLFGLTSLPAFAQNNEAALKKLSPELRQIARAKTSTDSITVSVSVSKILPRQLSFRILSEPIPGSIYVIRLPATELVRLAETNTVLFINRLHPPKEEINTGASDPTLNSITYAQHRFPEVRGEGFFASVKERLFDTTDIDLKGRVYITGLENTTVTSHASLMATIIAGAANSSPFARGAAPAAKVSSSSFTNLFPDLDSVFRKYNISLQNHSYGTIVENFYGNEAAAYDHNAFNNPQLLHVFSAGNAGTITDGAGPYAGVSGMANLTGNLKQAKNILTVSAVDSTAKLLPASSKGPAYDGRVKPELVAYGEDGSSGAAALVSGAAILVQDAFTRMHAGALPSSALTRAILLNSATDVGEKQIDYLTGYGMLNAYKALQTVADNRFFEGQVTAGEAASFTLTLPAGAVQLKLTLTWNDSPALPNAAKSLVNDLDIELRSPDGQFWQPWVLDPRPSATALLQPAVRGRDTLNNTEQISIANPVAGRYTINVRGTRLQTVAQAFALAYEVDTANTFYWTFPTSSDALVAGNRQIIRWQSNITSAGVLEYATDGNNWREIGTVDSLTKNHFQWTVPDTVTGASLRMVSGNNVLASDTFTISPQLRLQTGFNCLDSLLLYWRSLGVQQYRLYQLVEKYLEPVQTLSDTAVVLQKVQFRSLYFSIAPLLNGKEAIRSNAINYQNQGAGCYLRSFYLQSQTGLAAYLIAELGTLYQVAAVRLEVLAGGRYLPVRTSNNPQTARIDFTDVPVHPGENHFRLAIQLVNGTTLYSTETVYSIAESTPVFFYPNPVTQHDLLNILTEEVGRYTLLFFDANGKQVYRMELNESVTRLRTSIFGKGLFFIRILDREGKASSHKQVIF